MNTVVHVKGLRKSYGEVNAIDNVSFDMEENKIYGLLGRNGAGKTTIMHILTAQQFATEGELRLFGEHPFENDNVLSRVCFIKESQKYPDFFSVRDVLRTAASLYPNWDEAFAASLVEAFGLPYKRNMKKLSRGMLSAVGIIIGLASRAPLTIFDEPYLGLDAVARQLFYDQLLADYAEHPRTIILSTHLIDEVSMLLEHVLLIDRGMLLLDEDAESLRGRAYSVSGPSAAVEVFASGRTVIDRQALGGLVQLSILDDARYGHTGQDEAESLGLAVTPVSLQQLIVYCTRQQASNKKEANR
ncbi:ABC transporter related protein [Paenibacillus curdlanolyticus YK9]|uniref:ABC transporter related protein n=1 Tax=Paenibacillus curdlanolyticus YK9 TaxID=717606 RepID=E0I380_9BACL|nr:ABC transporter ATP-binding protein [Paenibacillus curdlanolyticus]EFM12744.1 ABC transporter related protein [Paenibacillus curdlanolyticus YK9]